ncbi:Uncharacterised protein [Mycobacteroides abscessus subsp. abscessus]|uniref:hypothetical protein n=1 Tax=Mycobacteroides abscessus TaxID=36809 RepID=UPI0009284795|nr:hypothetical protein [Mycobacteroides abscessus]SHS19261.1 Uncharacterised protein [Mycobacteroides abscessus subsp. abscessus]
MSAADNVKNELSEIGFSGAKYTRLRAVLQQARDGVLAADWRDHLVAQYDGTDPRLQVQADAESTAIAALQNMPPAPWEPGEAPNWKVALDSWYVTARNLHGEYFLSNMAQMGKQLAVGEKILRIPAETGGLNADYVITTVADGDRMRDKGRRLHTHQYIVERTRLTAYYLAGLAGGGLDVDWVSWYRAEAATWPDDQPDRARVEQGLTRAPFRSAMQKLPGYWRAPTP